MREEKGSHDLAVKILKLAKTAHIRFKSASPDEKRQIVFAMLSNCKFDGEKVVSDLHMPFDLMPTVSQQNIGADPEKGKSVDLVEMMGFKPTTFPMLSGRSLEAPEKMKWRRFLDAIRKEGVAKRVPLS